MISLHPGRLRLALAALAGAALLAGCSSTGERSPGADEPPPPPKHCTVDDCPELKASSERIRGSDITPENAETTVPVFLNAVLDDLDQVWQDWFTQLHIPDATAGRVLVEGNDTFVSECVGEDGERLTVRTDSPNAFYCALDRAPDGAGRQRQGSVILPVATFADIWDGRLLGERRILLGDFTASTVVAHEYGHNVMRRLEQAYRLPVAQRPQGDDNELLADCFGGNWASTVFARSDLSLSDVAQAVALKVYIGDPLPNQGHGTVPERVAALGRGFGLTGGGEPVDCLKAYWPDVLAPQS
ncbi:neutral zinc metallopeptidase [Gordonia iterans]|uniref:neutral zinc metallopeptidase n=1 Tax=Gordonia iterans TaxID=1004901 RepID=UPI001F19E0E0|nr:neutral zinc metallopeptidase [Gordonia iterans]